jgi:hypothetical protein
MTIQTNKQKMSIRTHTINFLMSMLITVVLDYFHLVKWYSTFGLRQATGGNDCRGPALPTSSCHAPRVNRHPALSNRKLCRYVPVHFQCSAPLRKRNRFVDQLAFFVICI